jgi:hypothetical protein
MVSKKSVEREGGGLMCLSELPRVGDENIVLHSGTSNWSSRTGSVNADDADTSGFEAPQVSEPRKEIVDVEHLLRPIAKLLAEHEVRLAVDLIRHVSRSSMGGMNTCIEKGDWVAALESFSAEKSDTTKDVLRDCTDMSGVKKCTLAVPPSALRQPGGALPRRPPNRRLLRTKAISQSGAVVTSGTSSG